MEQVPIITLTTDFGYKDPFSGIMKGVIFGINPSVNLVDLTHNISRYNVREAALVIGMSYGDFPPLSIHIAVVDPGVGSSRRPILVATEHHFFIGPDNGVFSMVYDENADCRIFHLTAAHYFRAGRGATFHGRDIFAPVAAWFSKKYDAANFGDLITDPVKLPIPAASRPTATTLEGEVLYIDAFGNAITSISEKDLDGLRGAKPNGVMRLVIKGREARLKEYYSQAEDKGLYALMNSMGHLELFVYRGNASGEFDIKVGDTLGIMVK